MSDAPIITPMMETADSQGVVKRLFKIAEILSRKASPAPDFAVNDENDPQNPDPREIGYRESKSRFFDT